MRRHIAHDARRDMLRLLAPAHPIRSGRLATVRASFSPALVGRVLASWEWEDGHADESEIVPAPRVLARRTHRYAASGVYRVRVGVGTWGPETRYVTVGAGGQIAGSGWVRDVETRSGIPFGFLITPSVEPGDDLLVLRCLLGADELAAAGITWLFATEPGSLHFGGLATIGDRPDRHPFRVDVHPVNGGHRRQQLALSLYAADAVPGRDSPVRRISGPIRPGRVDLGAFARLAGPAGG